MKKIIITLISVLFLVACTKGNPTDYPHPKAILTMDTQEVIEIELDPNQAPNTVNNFIKLAKGNFYDGLIFHRVIAGFMIQGGDPLGNGTGGPGYAIEGEFKNNGFNNSLKHTQGVISMARTSHKNGAGSQFFIMAEAAPHLDGDYAAFGVVTKGMDVVDRIISSQTDSQDRPIEDQRIQSIRIEDNGYEASEPQVIR